MSQPDVMLEIAYTLKRFLATYKQSKRRQEETLNSNNSERFERKKTKANNMTIYQFTTQALVALLIAKSSLAFSTTKSRVTDKLATFGSTRSNTRHFMSQEADGDWIKTVNAKEIFFDDRAGRFFETKKDYEEDEKSDEVSGPLPSNPFKKPEGTFFAELQKKFETTDEPVAVGSSSDVTESSSSSSSNGGFGFSLDSIFKSDSTPATEEKKGFDFFGELFKPKSEPIPEEDEPVYYDPVTISNDFRVAGAFLAGGLLLDQIPYIQLTLGPLVTLLGLLFLVQSFRIRFVFNEKNELELVNVKNILTGETESSGENLVVGGANVWACDTIVNYDFFPPIGSSPVGPILVYFKETQTDSKFWSDGPGEFANKEDKIKSGEAVAGQVHFFPAVCSSEQICEEFEKRGCGKL